MPTHRTSRQIQRDADALLRRINDPATFPQRRKTRTFGPFKVIGGGIGAFLLLVLALLIWLSVIVAGWSVVVIAILWVLSAIFGLDVPSVL